MGTEIRTSEADATTTYIEVVLKVEHDPSIGDDALHEACTNAFAGDTLIELPDPADPRKRISAVIDEVHTVWVKGTAP